MAGRSWAWMVLLLGLLPLAARAQEMAGDSIIGTGVAMAKKQPDALRMAVELQVDGADLKDALAKLKVRRAAIAPALVKLGAAEKSIEFNTVRRIEAGGTDQRVIMERMIRERMSGRKTPATGPSSMPAPPVTVSIMVQAEWPLQQAEPEDLLVASNALQEKIRAAKLFDPLKIERPKTEEEEEREGLDQSSSGYERNSLRPGEPMFVYVARISPEDRAKVMADAFAKARDNAATLAKAAGVQLGGLKQISSSVGAMRGGYGGYDGEYGGFDSNLRILQGRLRGDDSEQGNEAISPQPGQVSYWISVTTAFAIK